MPRLILPTIDWRNQNSKQALPIVDCLKSQNDEVQEISFLVPVWFHLLLQVCKDAVNYRVDDVQQQR